MLNVAIMRDDQHPDTYYKQEVENYDMPEIRKRVGETTGCRLGRSRPQLERYNEPNARRYLSRHRFKYSDYKIMS